MIRNFGIRLDKFFDSFPRFAVISALLFQFCSSSALGQTQLRESNQDDRYYSKVLERKVELMTDSMHLLEWKLDRTKIVMLSENVKKKAWIKLIVAESAIVAGVILVVTTGALVPVLMGVLAVEMYLIIEGNYRLNIRKLKKIRRESPERLKNYTN